jgi:hypothetical protein
MNTELPKSGTRCSTDLERKTILENIITSYDSVRLKRCRNAVFDRFSDDVWNVFRDLELDVLHEAFRTGHFYNGDYARFEGYADDWDETEAPQVVFDNMTWLSNSIEKMMWSSCLDIPYVRETDHPTPISSELFGETSND